MSEGVVFGAAPAGMAAKMGAGACADVEAETGAGVGVGAGVGAIHVNFVSLVTQATEIIR